MDCTLQDDLSPLHNLSKIILHPLNGPVIEFRLGRDFPYPSRRALGLTQPPAQWLKVLFRGKRWKSGRGVALTTHPYLAPRLQKE
jgi:hypothetical protein